MNKKEDWYHDDCPLSRDLLESGENVEVIDLDEELTELDEACDHVSDLLLLERYDEAEKAARKLMITYPDDASGLERLGLVLSFKGDIPGAIQAYESAIAFTHTVEGYRNEDREALRHRIRELQEKLS